MPIGTTIILRRERASARHKRISAQALIDGRFDHVGKITDRFWRSFSTRPRISITGSAQTSWMPCSFTRAAFGIVLTPQRESDLVAFCAFSSDIHSGRRSLVLRNWSQKQLLNSGRIRATLKLSVSSVGWTIIGSFLWWLKSNAVMPILREAHYRIALSRDKQTVRLSQDHDHNGSEQSHQG